MGVGRLRETSGGKFRSSWKAQKQATAILVSKALKLAQGNHRSAPLLPDSVVISQIMSFRTHQDPNIRSGLAEPTPGNADPKSAAHSFPRKHESQRTTLFSRKQDKVSLTIHEPVNATFALRYLVNFSKACVSASSILEW